MPEEMREMILTARDGMSIFIRAWIPDRPQRILICIQGLGGHGGYYEELAAQLADEGIIVVAPDLRGHGCSSGKRGDIDHFESYLLDVDAAVMWTIDCWPHMPIFMLGESMGASLAIHYVTSAVKFPQVDVIPLVPAGLILLSPVIRPTIHPTMREVIQFTRSLLTHPARPALAVTGREELGCRDVTFNTQLQADPLFVRLVSARFLIKLGLWLRHTQKRAHLLHLPLLILQGEHDHIAHPGATVAFIRRVGSKELKAITFPQAYHCLLHDPNTPAVINALTSWLTIFEQVSSLIHERHLR